MNKKEKCPEPEDLIKHFVGPVGRLIGTVTGEINGVYHNHRRGNCSLHSHVKRCKRCLSRIPHIWEAVARSNEVNRTVMILKKPLSRLTLREKKIIKRRFGLPSGITHSLEAIGRRYFSLTGERIRQIEKAALAKARSELQAVYPTFQLIPEVVAYLDKKKLNLSGKSETLEKVLSYPKYYQEIQLVLTQVLLT